MRYLSISQFREEFTKSKTKNIPMKLVGFEIKTDSGMSYTSFIIALFEYRYYTNEDKYEKTCMVYGEINLDSEIFEEVKNASDKMERWDINTFPSLLFSSVLEKGTMYFVDTKNEMFTIHPRNKRNR